MLVANKVEGRMATSAILDAYELGLGDPVGVSAEHGDGIADLMSEIAAALPLEVPAEEEGEDRPLKLAIVGRPNAGKSTLLNRLLGEDRMLVGPEPGLDARRDRLGADGRGGAADRDRRYRGVAPAGSDRGGAGEDVGGCGDQRAENGRGRYSGGRCTEGLNDQDLRSPS
jgi:GTP-binding protein